MKCSGMLRARAHPRDQVRLSRRDVSLVYSCNRDLFYRKLKVTAGELQAITDLSHSVWKNGDISPRIQCALGLSYITSNAHQHWLSEAMGVSQSSASRCFHRLIR